MSLKLNPNSGLAVLNEKGLERSEKAPKFKGEIEFEGRRIEVAVWERKTSNGKTMLCFNVADAVDAELDRVETRREYLHNVKNAGK